MRLMLLLMLLSFAPLLDAQVVHRCRGADGVTLFTDRPCHVHGATPIAAPEPVTGTSVAPGITLVPRADDAIPDAATGCPAYDPPQLVERIEQALIRRDLNALAALYAWNGASRREADRVLRDLQSLIDSHARGVRMLDHAWAADGLPRLTIYRDHHALNPQLSYDVVRGAGCVWLAG